MSYPRLAIASLTTAIAVILGAIHWMAPHGIQAVPDAQPQRLQSVRASAELPESPARQLKTGLESRALAPATSVAPAHPATRSTDHPVAAPDAIEEDPNIRAHNERQRDAAILEQVLLAAYELQRDERERFEAIASEGARMDAATFRAEEAAIGAKPDDPAPRIRALGYYAAHADSEMPRWTRRNAHILELFERFPQLPIAGTSFASLIESDGVQDYEQAIAIWETHLQASPEDPGIIINAAQFLGRIEPARAADLIALARRITTEDGK
ncbi:MAG: hypothetical protein HYV63_14660 [Candidatus Schekmanbacteria bacterium]|nr:hypothetical protein [Candidatus Schekmanbacteria bacterium]